MVGGEADPKPVQTAPEPKSGWGPLERGTGEVSNVGNCKGTPGEKRESAIRSPGTSRAEWAASSQVRIVAWGSADCRPLPSCVGWQAGPVGSTTAQGQAPRPAGLTPGLANQLRGSDPRGPPRCLLSGSGLDWRGLWAPQGSGPRNTVLSLITAPPAVSLQQGSHFPTLPGLEVPGALLFSYLTD